MICLCGCEFYGNEWEKHQQEWVRHGICLHKAAMIRARKAGCCTTKPINFDLDYYVSVWLRLMRGKNKTMGEAVLYCLAVYLADSEDFRRKFMQGDQYPMRVP